MNVVGTGLTLRACPQFSISREALFGENGRNLKEFELGERGELTSLSSDPWIYYAFGEPVNVRFLTVEVSGVGGAGSEAQLYLIPSAGYRTMALTDGRLSARFGRAQGYRGVSAIRLDLATEPGAVLTVEGAVVNDRLAVILDFQKLYLSAWALGLLAVLEAAFHAPAGGTEGILWEIRTGGHGLSKKMAPHPGRCGATGNFKGRDSVDPQKTPHGQ